MSLLVKKGTFLRQASGVTQQVRGVGFQPKLIIAWKGISTVDATWGAHASFSWGAAHDDGAGGIKEYGASLFDTDALGTSDTALAGFDVTHTLLGFTEATSLAAQWTADIVALDVDGFDVFWFGAPANANEIVHYFALGGSDITAIASGQVNSVIAATQNVTVATGWGQPDLVIFPETTFGGNAANAKMVLGFAKSATERACVGYMAQDAATTMNIGTYMAAKAGFAFTSTTVTAEAEWDLSAKASWPTDGFQVAYSDQWAATSRLLFYIAIKGTFQSAVGVADSPVAAGNQDIAAGFTPSAAIVFSDDLPAHAAIDITHTDLGGMGFGAYDGTTQGMTDFQQDDANTTSVAKNLSDAAHIIRLTGPGATPTNLGIGTASFSTTNLRIAWTGVGATARRFGYVILGAAPGGGSTPISGTDANGTTTEAGTVVVKSTVSDADGTPSEITSLASAYTQTDVDGTPVETATPTIPPVLQSGTDSGTASAETGVPGAVYIQADADATPIEIGSQTFAPIQTDTGTDSETTNTGLIGSDVNGAVTDSGSVSVPTSGTDAGSGSDVISAVAKTLQDVNGSSEAASSSAVASASDSGAGSEAGLEAYRPSVTDAGAGSENLGTISSPISATDTNGATTEAVSEISLIPAADSSAPGVDSSSLLARISALDLNSSLEAVQAVVTLVQADSGQGSESGSTALFIFGAETGSGSDVAALKTAPVASETASGVDAVALKVVQVVQDTGLGVQVGSITFAVIQVDTGSGFEASIIGIRGSDAATGADDAHLEASGVFISVSDFAQLLDYGFVEIYKPGFFPEPPQVITATGISQPVLTGAGEIDDTAVQATGISKARLIGTDTDAQLQATGLSKPKLQKAGN